MLQNLPKFQEVAQKTASRPKVAEQLVDRAKGEWGENEQNRGVKESRNKRTKTKHMT